ncbi:site-2 protease family protein [Propionivibrio soli]|uniref:site-2 protease family protein n=1 Tax=Propionivibrio soli TaxID=2976531 RepID=UPI0021E7483F
MDAVLIQTIAIAALPVIFAITLHEAAHGYAARHFGDPTAWLAGRISLNPARHIDPIGTLLVPGVILAMSYMAAGSAMLFGWAKPVPVNFGQLRHPKRDMLWVAAAGPATNLLMAIGWAAMFKFNLAISPHVFTVPLAEMSRIGLNVNLVLMVLNLLPLPPLDGGRIAVSLLPYPAAVRFAALERWGFPVLLVLMFTGILGDVMGPFVALFRHLIILLFQLN